MAEEIKPMVKDWKFSFHMSMSNGGQRDESGTVVWPGNPIDGKTIIRSIWTPKSKNGNFGTPEVTFLLSDDKAPEFKTIEEFVAFYTAPAPVEPIEPQVKVKPNAKKK